MSSISFTFRLLSLALLLPLLVHAQMSELYDTWRWVRFGTESGLPSEKILGIYESGNDEVWVHTPEGLAWFDGFQWHTVSVPGMPHPLSDALVIVPDTSGILVSFNYRLYSIRREVVQMVPLYDGTEYLSTVAAWRGPDGTLIVQGDSLLYRVMDSVATQLTSPYSPGQFRGVQPPVTTNYIIPTDKDLWVKAGPTIFRYADGRWERAFHSSSGFLRVQHLVENTAGWGMAVLEPVTGAVQVHGWSPQGPLKELPGEYGDLVQSIASSPDGRFLLLYMSGELRLRREGTWSTLPPLPPPVDKPRFLRFRPGGDLWVGGDKGLYLCRISHRRWVNWREPSPSMSNIVCEIIRAKDGTFWIGTRDGVQMRTPDGHIRWFRKIAGVPLGRITGIGEDPSGRIWIGSGATFEGAFCWNGRSWTHYGAKEGLTAPRIHRIAKDRRGRLWFLGLNLGILRADLSDEPGAFVLDGDRFTQWGRAQGLLDGRVYSFVEDSKGGYWFGTWSGLSRFRNNAWTYWQMGHGLRESRVWTLAIDSTDRVYFSHQYTGLGYFDENDSVRYVELDEGLVGDQVYEVEIDRRGWVWVATMEGLGCWAGGEWTRFDAHAGLPNDQLWPVLPLDREILVGTQGDGVAILRLDELTLVPPRVRIAAPMIEPDNATINWQPYAHWGDLSSALIETRFRLSGSAWSTWSTQHTVTYRDLPPGTYRFDVQVKVSPGAKQASLASSTFTVPPPLFLRPNVAIPIGILLSLVVGMALTAWLRHQAYNRAIRENEARFRAQYKGLPVPTFTFMKTDVDFVLNDYNDEAKTYMLGGGLDLLGKRFEEIFPDNLQGRALLEECFRSRSTVRQELRYEYKSVRRSLDLAMTCAFVPPDLVMVHAEDVSDRKRNEAHLQESREQLRALATRLESVREEERAMLSREIHDELGQLMTGLKMDLALIRRRVMELGQGIPDAVSQRIAQMNSVLEDAIQTVRKIAGQLRPAVLDDLGLVAAIEWQARDFGERTGIRCEIALGVDELRMAPERATEFFRIFQELLTNVVRHAQASVVGVTLTCEAGALTLEVRDNGKGIQPEDIRRPASLGILGMEERARRINGTLSIMRGKENGTVARISVPLEPGEHA
jgi:signal transduction histidine kinase/ligand-binding sensor domain-containing protein